MELDKRGVASSMPLLVECGALSRMKNDVAVFLFPV